MDLAGAAQPAGETKTHLSYHGMVQFVKDWDIVPDLCAHAEMQDITFLVNRTDRCAHA